jgi:hypothetical protein
MEAILVSSSLPMPKTLEEMVGLTPQIKLLCCSTAPARIICCTAMVQDTMYFRNSERGKQLEALEGIRDTGVVALVDVILLVGGNCSFLQQWEAVSLLSITSKVQGAQLHRPPSDKLRHVMLCAAMDISVGMPSCAMTEILMTMTDVAQIAVELSLGGDVPADQDLFALHLLFI